MKFKMKFSLPVYLLSGLIVAFTLAGTVINIMILAGAGRFVKGNVAVTSVSLACSLILLTLCITLLVNSYYVFKDKQLNTWYGVVRLRLDYQKIIAAAEDETSKKLYVQYSDESNKMGFSIIAINVDTSLNADFIAKIIDKNPNVKHKEEAPQSDNEQG